MAHIHYRKPGDPSIKKNFKPKSRYYCYGFYISLLINIALIALKFNK